MIKQSSIGTERDRERDRLIWPREWDRETCVIMGNDPKYNSDYANGAVAGKRVAIDGYCGFCSPPARPKPQRVHTIKRVKDRIE